MASARAAVAVRARRNQEMKALEREQKESIDRWFQENDTDNDGMLGREELRVLLTAVCKIEPCEGALDMAMAMGGTNSAQGVTRYSAQGVTRSNVNDVVAKTTEYVKVQSSMEPIFQRMDTDKSGGLDSKELLELLKMMTTQSGYNAEGITTADVDMLLKVSDVNFSGHIERIELLPACITWKTMLANKEAPHQQSKKSSACTLL